MTEYSDVEQVNKLYVEQQQVQAAISLIDNGGKMTSFAVSPPEPPPDTPPVGTPVYILVADAQQSTMDALRAQLVTRYGAINTELASLGVTNTPGSLR